MPAYSSLLSHLALSKLGILLLRKEIPRGPSKEMLTGGSSTTAQGISLDADHLVCMSCVRLRFWQIGNERLLGHLKPVFRRDWVAYGEIILISSSHSLTLIISRYHTFPPARGMNILILTALDPPFCSSPSLSPSLFLLENLHYHLLGSEGEDHPVRSSFRGVVSFLFQERGRGRG